MGLSWNVEKVEGYEEKCFYVDEECGPDERKLSPLTNALIWHTLSVGLNEITEDNVANFYARVALIEKIDGPSLRGKDGPYSITPEDVKSHIGLWTNATSYTDAGWFEHALETRLKDFERRYGYSMTHAKQKLPN